MKLMLNKCKKFSYLLNEQEDRVLSDAENTFMAAHSDGCKDCADLERSSTGLNLLRDMAEPMPTFEEGYTDRLVRIIRLQLQRQSLRYWSPAIVGGIIACVAVLSALQLIMKPNALPVFSNPTVESRLSGNGEPMIPALHKDQKSNMP